MKLRAGAARAGDALATGFGFLVNRLVRQIRRVLSTGADDDPANIAVVCMGFLRYGSYQAVALQQIGCNVTLYYAEGRVKGAGRDPRSDAGARGGGRARVHLPQNERDRMLLLDHARAA